ncbi:hypothetical protein ACFQPA_02470 [Halomarina halobia]|uniref:Uncharacterized protein n=1 Tax=Halomarina halobia TaxID=3033386 RepID=A0ABD6A4K5_9EURY|nr:hypothetical protein [Halomarina sp. PSR21]
MATAPFLARDGDELKLIAAVGTARRQFDLTDRAVGLLRERGYDAADVVPWVTARALVLAGGATLPEGNDARETAWDLRGADGGRRATDEECRELAAYLTGLRIENRTLETLREHVRETRLSAFVDPDDLRGRSARVNALNDIAKDL